MGECVLPLVVPKDKETNKGKKGLIRLSSRIGCEISVKANIRIQNTTTQHMTHKTSVRFEEPLLRAIMNIGSNDILEAYCKLSEFRWHDLEGARWVKSQPTSFAGIDGSVKVSAPKVMLLALEMAPRSMIPKEPSEDCTNGTTLKWDFLLSFSKRSTFSCLDLWETEKSDRWMTELLCTTVQLLWS